MNKFQSTTIAVLLSIIFFVSCSTASPIKPTVENTLVPPAITNESKLIDKKWEVANTSGKDVTFTLEPWAVSYPLKAGETIIITGNGPTGGDIEIVRFDGKIIVYGWVGSTLKASLNGKVIIDGSSAVPEVPNGMSVRQFIEMMFGTGDDTKK
jgi:hypothetical protein